MSVLTKLVSKKMGLPPARHSKVVRERDLAATMPDGVVLMANRWYPEGQDGGLPTVLMRSPYGRAGLWAFEAPLLAERGYNVIVQACRGTHGSGGEWDPFRHEHVDGRATLTWITEQPWYDGRLATYGSSYCGFTQFAATNGAPAGQVQAMAPSVAASDLRSLFYPYGIFSLESLASWVYGLDPQGRRSKLGTLKMFRGSDAARTQAAEELPLRDVRDEEYFKRWLDNPDVDEPFWDPLNMRAGIAGDGPAITLLSGWYDIFTPETVRDFQELQAGGRDVDITVGPGEHGYAFGLRLAHAVELYDRVFTSGAARGRKPVNLQLEGDKRWLQFDSWPQPGRTSWHLQPSRGLATSPAPPSDPDSYVYDPSDPTPSLGGACLSGGGPKDNASREERSDVLTYTSAPLVEDLNVLGTPSATIHVTSTAKSFDVVVRLCVVDEKGVSRNVSDGITRLSAGETTAQIDLWPIGVKVAKGSRIRVQVASALHPLFARNLGTGDPIADAVDVLVSTQQVRHDPEHPSLLALPVVHVTEADLVR